MLKACDVFQLGPSFLYINLDFFFFSLHCLVVPLECPLFGWSQIALLFCQRVWSLGFSFFVLGKRKWVIRPSFPPRRKPETWNGLQRDCKIHASVWCATGGAQQA